jgi:fatty-acyl-CoA synthase
MPKKKELSHWYDPLTPLSFIERAARIMPDKVAVIHEDKSWTWKETFERVTQLSNALKKIGVKKGEPVAFISRNFPPHYEAHFGVPLSSGVLVSINYRLSAPEVTTIVNLSGAKVMFVDSGVADCVNPADLPTVKTYINIYDGRDAWSEKVARELPGVSYEEFIRKASKEYTRLHLKNENDLIAIDYTSGTTGNPKGCMYSHRSTYLHAITKIIEHSLNQYSVYLWSLPMFHCNGWCWTWATAGVGATNVCMRAPDPEQMWKMIDKYGVTHMAGPPIIFQRLRQYMDEHGVKKFPNKVIINNAAAPPPENMLLDMEKKGAEIRHAYGLTETYGPFTICEWQPKWDKLPLEERIGLKMRQGVPDITAGDIRVVTGEGAEDDPWVDVPWDGKTMGEILMRGNDVVQGYYKAPEENAKAFVAGWMKTGDGGVIHPDGYLEVKDRFKDLIISGGENIIGTEVENAIYEHHDVDEVVCFGKPDPKWGEVVKCLVHPKPGKNPTEKEIIDFTRERLTHFKCPREIEFGEIPRTSAGKVQKYILRRREKEKMAGQEGLPRV